MSVKAKVTPSPTGQRSWCVWVQGHDPRWVLALANCQSESEAIYEAVKRGWTLEQEPHRFEYRDGAIESAKPCTCGDGQVLCGKRASWCGVCYAVSLARVLEHVPLWRLNT